MPFQQCEREGKNGFCYTGAYALEKAEAQGRAIKAQQNKSKSKGR